MKFTKTIFAILIPSVGIGFFATILLFQGIEANESFVIEEDYVKKAVVIDQLYASLPNKYFQNKSITYLENAGYHVDYFQTEQITVDFYKELPSKEYEYIVIRSHGIKGSVAYDSAKLFTGEKYSDEKYILDQLSGKLTKGNFFQTHQASMLMKIDDIDSLNNGGTIEMRQPLRSNNIAIEDTSQNYFLVGSSTVDSLMNGKFPASTILLGGCNTMENSLLAESLIKRGASEVIGWSGLVRSHENDSALLAILKETLENQMSSEHAVESFMEDYYQQPDSTLELKYYSKNNI